MHCEARPKTIICDIDGTLIKHFPPTETASLNHTPELLDGTLEKILEWDKKGYNIILISGRRECSRHVTIRQLNELGIIYDQLILGIGGGKRILINDRKPYGSENYALAINLERNKGISEINL